MNRRTLERPIAVGALLMTIGALTVRVSSRQIPVLPQLDPIHL
jgi:hypothetical protein